MEQKFTHFDENGNARMVDVSEKEITSRTALAKGSILVSRETSPANCDPLFICAIIRQFFYCS